MKGVVSILSEGDGWRNEVNGPCDILLSQGKAVVCYRIEEDECVFTVTEKTAEQARTGKINLNISFSVERETLCRLSSDGMSGGFPVITRSLDVRFAPDGVHAHLRYYSGADREQIVLTLRAHACGGSSCKDE